MEQENQLQVLRTFARTVSGKRRVFCLCKCRCGTDFEVRKDHLNQGKNCGCLRRKKETKPKRRRHGKSYTPEYQVWEGMIRRCHTATDKSYYLYGERGIKVCEEWRRDFLAFYNHVGERPSPKHSIDRFPDNDGNYEPGNVRWATAKQQNRHTRKNVLDEVKVAEIRAIGNDVGVAALALRYGCTPNNITAVLNGKTWVD